MGSEKDMEIPPDDSVFEESDDVGATRRHPVLRLIAHGKKKLVRPKKIDGEGAPKDDPFLVRVLRRDYDERRFSTHVCDIVLLGALLFFAFKVGSWAFVWVASGKDFQFPPIMAYPVGLTSGFLAGGLIICVAMQLSARGRRRFAVLMAILVWLVLFFKL